MRPRTYQLLGGLMALALSLACGSGSTSSGNSGSLGTVSISVVGQYEKRVLSASGFSPALTIFPARYAYAEVVNRSSGRVEAAGTLGVDGTRTFTVPKGTNLFVALYATAEVPNVSPNSGFYFYGGVKRGQPTSTYANADTFNGVTVWSTTSTDVVANSSGTLNLLALASTGEAGAFSIADQMVTFAFGLRQVEPTLVLPELYSFWNPGTVSTYPTPAFATNRTTVLSQGASLGGRVIFQHEARYAAPTALDWGADAYNDGVLLECFSRMLFDDYSLAFSNGAFSSIVRRDNDNAFVLPNFATESSLAFVSGFTSFLSCAFRNDPFTYEISNTGAIAAFRLDQHGGFTPTGGGEFYPGSVARTLWGIWTNSSIFNRSQNGLKTMWNATIPSMAPNAYEYGNTPLACYPTYLTGLRRLAGASSAAAFTNELRLELVGNGTDPTSPLYLDGPTLWTVVPSLPINASDSFPTNQAALGYYYDQNTAKAYRFVQSFAGPRTITLSTPGVGLLVELFDTSGPRAWAEASNSSNGVINLAGLSPGTYVVRVRVDPLRTYPNSTIPYILAVN